MRRTEWPLSELDAALDESRREVMRMAGYPEER